MKCHSKIEHWKTFEKIIQQVFLMFYTLKKWKCVQLAFQKLTLTVKNDPNDLLMIPNIE